MPTSETNPCFHLCKGVYIDAFTESCAQLHADLDQCGGDTTCRELAIARHRARVESATTDYWACLTGCITGVNS